MKSSYRSIAALVLAAAAFIAAQQTQAQSARIYEAQPGSKVKLDGTSTVHDWTVESQLVGGSFEISDAFGKDLEAKKIKVIPSVNVAIAVRSLKSGKKPMDNIMYDAMKMQEHPKITYKLETMTLKEPPAKPGAMCSFITKGDLTVAGVKKPIIMTVKMEPSEPNKLKFSGQTEIKMTDFGIQPPAPALAGGLIKTGDEVKVSFEWLTALKAP